MSAKRRHNKHSHNASSSSNDTSSRSKKNKQEDEDEDDDNIFNNKNDPNNKTKSMSFHKKLWWFAVVIAVFGFLIMLRYNAEQYAWSGLERESKDENKGEIETNYYEILEISHNANNDEIKKAYKRLAFKYHPDRNPQCGQKCEEMQAKINKAYETLSNPDTRKIYDATEGSIKSITSTSIELTAENFDDYVTYSRGLFVIQVYTEWYKECSSFAPVWEEAVHRFSGYVNFGRVHGSRQRSVVRRLGTAVRDYPTILSYIDGEYLRTYPAIRFPQQFFDLVIEDFPIKHLWIATEETLEKNVVSKWKKLEESKRLPLIMIASKKIQPSLLVSWLGSLYQGVFQFVHLYPKPLSMKAAKLSVHKESTGRVSFLSKALTNAFNVPSFDRLPKIITISSQGKAALVDEEIDKNSLQKYVRNYVAKMTPQLSTWTYTTICQESDILCILYIRNCQNNLKEEEEWKTYKYKLNEFKKFSNQSIQNFEEVYERYSPRWIQFGEIDVVENKELLRLCVDNETKIVVVTDEATILYNIEDAFKMNGEEFWKSILDFLEHTSQYPPLDAPRIVPPKLKKPNIIEKIRNNFQEFDWNSSDFQLNVGIIATMIIGYFILKNIGIGGCVMFIFALSIFGSIFQSYFSIFFHGDDGTGVPRYSKQKSQNRQHNQE